MKSRWMVLSLVITALVAVGGLKAAKEDSKKEFKATCPVADKPAKEENAVELKSGDKVYFCCENCPKEFKKNRAKYTLQVNRQLVETEQVVQVACPLTGKPVNKEQMVDAGEAKVGLCCKGCAGKYAKASDEEKLKLLFAAKDFNQGFTHQTKCPVSGKPIDPEKTVEYKGKKVYFCCPNCPAAFEKDPEKFADKLPQLKEKPAGKKKKDAA